MRLSLPAKRIAALSLLCLAFTAQAASAISPPRTHSITPQSGGTTVAGNTFVVASPYGTTCSDRNACTVRTTLTAIVQKPGAPARLAPIGRSTLNLERGETGQIITRLNAMGAAELRRAGAIRVRMAIQVVDAKPLPVPSAQVTSSTRLSQVGLSFSRVHVAKIPPVVMTHNSRARAVHLAPGQRLVLRFGGENASTGYAWKFDALPSDSSLRRISSRSIPARNCRPGTVGCFSIREVVYAGNLNLLTRPVTITAGLYGPQPMTDATVRFRLNVTLSEAPKLPLVVGPRQNGSDVTIYSGQALVVQLPGGDRLTGERWTVVTEAGNDVATPFATTLFTTDTGAEFTEISFPNPNGPGIVSLAYGAPGATPSRTFRITTGTVSE